MKTGGHVNFPIQLSSQMEEVEGVKQIGMDGFLEVFPEYSSLGVTTSNFPAVPEIGYMSRDELAIVSNLVSILQPDKIFEFGTFKGLTTSEMLRVSPGSKITTLDILKDDIADSGYFIDETNKQMAVSDEKAMYIAEAISSGIIEFIGTDSAKFEVGDRGGKYDFVFVDACHTFDYVINDTKKAFELVGDNGVIVWHDYNKVKYMPGPTEALNKIARETGMNIYWIFDRDYREFQTSIAFTVVN